MSYQKLIASNNYKNSAFLTDESKKQQ